MGKHLNQNTQSKMQAAEIKVIISCITPEFNTDTEFSLAPLCLHLEYAYFPVSLLLYVYSPASLLSSIQIQSSHSPPFVSTQSMHIFLYHSYFMYNLLHHSIHRVLTHPPLSPPRVCIFSCITPTLCIDTELFSPVYVSCITPTLCIFSCITPEIQSSHSPPFVSTQSMHILLYHS